MRSGLILAAICLGIAIGVIYGEQCRWSGDCDHTTCPTEYKVDCHDELNLCTCTHIKQCISAHPDCNDPNCTHAIHCLDNVCRCGVGYERP
ncbi:hypothetical protein DPMN_008334 [Dreissena polymorpha]|uniref:Uncharacterized protein n=1 Tax=Dreissena polymorpha TaxID=45954 RepID=A0A9D4RWU1_DREPO|nr:hypothetical protein DPMN_008334 [Dreissena polymorpha]